MAYVVTAKWTAHPGKEGRLAALCEEMTEPSRAEPGNLFYLYEQYVDQAGYEAHMDSEHFTRLVKGEAIPELLEAREREFFETLS